MQYLPILLMLSVAGIGYFIQLKYLKNNLKISLISRILSLLIIFALIITEYKPNYGVSAIMLGVLITGVYKAYSDYKQTI